MQSQAYLQETKELYELRKEIFSRKILPFRKPNRTLQYQRLQNIKQNSSNKEIIKECEYLESKIRHSQVDDKLTSSKLTEITDFLDNTRINNSEKLYKINSYELELKDLRSYYKTRSNKPQVALIKSYLPKISDGREYYNFLTSANKDLEDILRRCFKMNRKTDFYLKDSIFHYFRMRKIGRYMDIINNDSLKYSDQKDNEDLSKKVNQKNESLSNLNSKLRAKIHNVRLSLDENLDHIKSYLNDRHQEYTKSFLIKQRHRLSFIKLKYRALRLYDNLVTSEVLTKEIDIRLDKLKPEKSPK